MPDADLNRQRRESQATVFIHENDGTYGQIRSPAAVARPAAGGTSTVVEIAAFAAVGRRPGEGRCAIQRTPVYRDSVFGFEKRFPTWITAVRGSPIQ